MNLKSIAAAALAALSVSAFAPAAQADTDFSITIGSRGHHYMNDDCVWIGHRYDCIGAPHFVEPFWMRRGSDLRRHHHRRIVIIDRMSCGEAKWELRDRGFRKVVARDCEGRTYQFTARKNGKRYLVKVNAETGAMSAHRT